MSAPLAQKYGLQSVYPHPARWQAERDGSLHLTFPVIKDDEDVRIELGGMPIGSGFLNLSARLENEQPVSWSQVILP